MDGPGRASPAAAPAVLGRPDRVDATRILLAVIAVSTSGPLIAATRAPALAIAFWRNALAAAVLVPLALFRRWAELKALTRREYRLVVAAGVLLAAHFATWVPSLTLTSVASATALVTAQPVWAALLAAGRGQRVPPGAWAGIVVAVVGAGLVGGGDFTVSGRAFAGDSLALVGGMLAAGYVTVGAEVRRVLSTTTYAAGCYTIAAVVLLCCCLAAGQGLTGYRAGDWGKLVALTVGAQFLGHTMVNRVLRTTSATVVSVALLFEAPGAAAIAWGWLGQHPRSVVWAGLVLLVTGVAVVAWRGGTPAARLSAD